MVERTSPVSETLKPCPFCGEANVGFGRTGQKWQTVSCNECGAEGPCTEIDRDLIIAKWNARTSDLAQTPAVTQSDEELALEIHDVAGCQVGSERCKNIIKWYRSKTAVSDTSTLGNSK